MRHLTHTGYWAGQPICGQQKAEDDTGWHAVWLTTSQLAEYRTSSERCDQCLAVWDSLDTEAESA